MTATQSDVYLCPHCGTLQGRLGVEERGGCLGCGRKPAQRVTTQADLVVCPGCGNLRHVTLFTHCRCGWEAPYVIYYAANDPIKEDPRVMHYMTLAEAHAKAEELSKQRSPLDGHFPRWDPIDVIDPNKNYRSPAQKAEDQIRRATAFGPDRIDQHWNPHGR